MFDKLFGGSKKDASTDPYIELSCIMCDMDVTVENGKEQFEKLFKKADEYDDLLKINFGCINRLSE